MAEETPFPHQALFREEVSWLRWIFGLRTIPSPESLLSECLVALPPPPGVYNKGCKILLPVEIKANLNAVLAKDRQIVLVVYGGYQDLLLLQDIELDLSPVHIIDVQKASQTVLQLSRQLSLEELATVLRFLFKYLHDSQHDVALKGWQQALLSILQAIAQSITLNSTIWLDKPDEENWKRLHKAKFTTTKEERQEKNKEKNARRVARRQWKKGR
ncbi:hypothetical protein B7494_g930 [Chlorociboria aeruginascens]|nr:hypothetical protein B7494_g930 [Chlorociboria aeruginascens]